jgi:hypothetical protein
MAKRGPAKGSAAALAAGERAAATRRAKATAKVAALVAPPEVVADAPVLSAAHRENPEKLSGQALKDLGHRRGLSKSAMDSMSDERIRMELRYLAYAQYAEA